MSKNVSEKALVFMNAWNVGVLDWWNAEMLECWNEDVLKSRIECRNDSLRITYYVLRIPVPRRSAWSIQKSVGGFIVDESFGLGIPFKRAVEPIGDVAQVADGYRPAADLDVADGASAGADAFEPVGAVVFAAGEEDFPWLCGFFR